MAMLAFPALVLSQCRYPCWSEIAADQFTYESFESQPRPTAAFPYVFSFPYPPQLKGASSAECNAHENPNVDLYRYNSQTQTWSGPESGPIYRNPAYIEISAVTRGWKGIALQVSYQGKIDSPNGHTLVDSVFFHTERCYRASTEFGFSHYVKGRPGDAQIFFYYEINANCQPKGKCRVHGTGETLTDTRVNLPIPIPTVRNSRGGSDWLYEAYLTGGGAKWHIRVVDPHTHKEQTKPIDHDVHDFFVDIAKGYAGNGAVGYVTATATRDGVLEYSSDPPFMNIARIYAAK